jgi:hypothetical protein
LILGWVGHIEETAFYPSLAQQRRSTRLKS